MDEEVGGRADGRIGGWGDGASCPENQDLSQKRKEFSCGMGDSTLFGVEDVGTHPVLSLPAWWPSVPEVTAQLLAPLFCQD